MDDRPETVRLLDELADSVQRYVALGPARALNETERRHLEEAKSAVRSIALDRHVQTWPITDDDHLAELARNHASAFTPQIDTDVWSRRHSFHFLLIPLHIADKKFEKAIVSLCCDFDHDPTSGEAPLFLALFPESRVTKLGDVEASIDAAAGGNVRSQSAVTPPPLTTSPIAGSPAISGHMTLQAKASLNVAIKREWHQLSVRTSGTPTANACWELTDFPELRAQAKPAIAFILQVPRAVTTTRISHLVQIQFRAAPWTKTIARWIEKLRLSMNIMTEPERRHLSLLDGYVRTGFWAAEYTEEARIWSIETKVEAS